MEKDFPCFLANCRSSFDEGRALMCHVKVLHSSEDILRYRCRYKSDCFREFDRLKSFEKHVLSHEKSWRKFDDSCHIKKPKTISLDEVCQGETEDDKVRFEDRNSQIGSGSGSGTNADGISTLLFFNAVDKAVKECLARLYTKDTLTRKQIQEVVEEMKELFCNSFIDILKDTVLEALKTSNSAKISEIQCLFAILKGMFNDVDTEWKRIKMFTEHSAYIKPQKYVVGTANVQKSVKGQIIVEPVSLTGSFIPTRKILQGFLEIPGVFDQILSYMDNLDKDADVMENVIQGSLWKNEIKPKFGDKLVLPLNVSFDDVETNKDLGSHATVHKLSVTHVSIGCLPPVHQSALENRFLTLLFHSSDKAFGLYEVFRPFIEELKYLEKEGIVITLGERKEKVYFALCLLEADNLGFSFITGRVECFVANFFCCLCKVFRNDSQNMVRENEKLLRTIENYKIDLSTNDSSKTGLKEECIWNELLSFHVTTNIYADIMHDVLEGFGCYDMCFVIEYLVLQKTWITYDELNDLIQGFFYGEQEFGNKPPLISPERVKRESLGFSASETLCLIRFFPLMVGHKIQNEEDPVWKFYLSLRELVGILFTPTFSRSCVIYLKELIAQHHESYLSLTKQFGTAKTLRPKFHNAVHYSRIIEKIGPLQPVMTMRSEAKYKELRQAAHVTSCRKNIAYTLAIKASLKVCARFLTSRGLQNKFVFSECEEVPIRELEHYQDFEHKVPPVLNVVKWVNVNGTLYKPGMVVVTALDDHFPIFGVLEIISVTECQEAMFLVKNLLTLGFRDHLHASHVKLDPHWDSWSFIKQKDLVTYSPAHIRLFFDGEKYVMLRNDL